VASRKQKRKEANEYRNAIKFNEYWGYIYNLVLINN